MGTRVYTWSELQAMPHPENSADEVPAGKKRLRIARLTTTQEAACRHIQLESYVDTTNGYVIGFGRMFHFPNTVAIMVTLNFDVSHPERFPDKLDGEPVVYITMPR
jgi:hypothetical protein